MSTQMTQNPSNLPSKQVMTNFVHDVADMETKAFTMREAARTVRKDAEKKKRDFEQAVKNRQVNLNYAYSAYDSAVKGKEKISTLGKWRNYNTTAGNVVGFIFGACFVVAGIIGNSFVIGSEEMGLPGSISVWFGIYLSLAVATFIEIPHYAKLKKKHRQSLAEEDTKIAELLAKYQHKRHLVEEAQADLDAFLTTIPSIQARADRLDADAELIEEKIRQCYALDIIKPAYRKMVCVVVIDEIFANDKADTMREAMILCDAEIRHADVMGKMDEIIDALHMLAYRLQSMTMVLENINTNVGLISQDVYDMRNSQEQMKFSLDAIRRSADNVDHYVNQRRMGML